MAPSDEDEPSPLKHSKKQSKAFPYVRIKVGAVLDEFLGMPLILKEHCKRALFAVQHKDEQYAKEAADGPEEMEQTTTNLALEIKQ